MQFNQHQWIHGRKAAISDLLLSLGLTTVAELMRCSLLIHLSYGGDTNDGTSVCVKVNRVRFTENGIYFLFEHDRIEVDFSVELGKELGGAFEGFNDDETIQIDNVSFINGRWTANFWYEFEDSESCRSLNEENMRVEIVKP